MFDQLICQENVPPNCVIVKTYFRASVIEIGPLSLVVKVTTCNSRFT